MRSTRSTTSPVFLRGTTLPPRASSLVALFRGPHEAADALRATIDFLQPPDKKNGIPAENIGFIVKRVRVEFRKGIENIEVTSQFASDLATITVPIRGSESTDELFHLETVILRDFLPAIPESQLRSALLFLDAIGAEGRRKLIQLHSRRKRSRG